MRNINSLKNPTITSMFALFVKKMLRLLYFWEIDTFCLVFKEDLNLETRFITSFLI